MIKILKRGGGGFWDDVNGGYQPENLVLTARLEEIDLVLLKVTTELSRCKSAKMQARSCLELIWLDTDNSVDHRSQEISIETVCQGIQDEEARPDSKNLTCFSVVLCNATA